MTKWNGCFYQEKKECHFFNFITHFHLFYCFDWNCLIFPIWNAIYFVGKSNVGAGKSSLMSFSDDLGLTNFRRKMEGMCPMREKRKKTCLFLAGVRISALLFIHKSTFLLCTLIWRVNCYVFCQENVETREMKVPNYKPFCTDDFNQFHFCFSNDTDLNYFRFALRIKIISAFNIVIFSSSFCLFSNPQKYNRVE